MYKQRFERKHINPFGRRRRRVFFPVLYLYYIIIYASSRRRTNADGGDPRTDRLFSFTVSHTRVFAGYYIT